jgi:hypothetical protein
MQQQIEDDILSALNNYDTSNTTRSCNFGLSYNANVPGHVVSRFMFGTKQAQNALLTIGLRASPKSRLL